MPIQNGLTYLKNWVSGNNSFFTNINNLVKPFYDDIDHTIHFERIPDTEEGRNILKQLANEYWVLHRIKKYSKSSNAEDVKAFIEENVVFDTNDEAYKAQWAAAFEQKSGQWIKLWTLVTSEVDDNGKITGYYYATRKRAC